MRKYASAVPLAPNMRSSAVYTILPPSTVQPPSRTYEPSRRAMRQHFAPAGTLYALLPSVTSTASVMPW